MAAKSGSLNGSLGSIRYLNVSQKETVHQRILLVHGVLEWKQKEEPEEISKVLVSFTSQSSLPPFPSQRFPCFKNHFKALIHLEIGPNQISFRCISSLDLRLENSKLEVIYLPLYQNPPLHLAILVASDSKLQFDVPLSKEANRGLEDATKKLRTIAYLWQAFTGEQMHRQGYGRRTFRVEEGSRRFSPSLFPLLPFSSFLFFLICPLLLTSSSFHISKISFSILFLL
jgi:hypothetical protein